MRIGDAVAMQLYELQNISRRAGSVRIRGCLPISEDRDEQARCRLIYAMAMRWWIIGSSEVSIMKLHIVWAHGASYSHTVSHHTAHIH